MQSSPPISWGDAFFIRPKIQPVWDTGLPPMNAALDSLCCKGGGAGVTRGRLFFDARSEDVFLLFDIDESRQKTRFPARHNKK